MVKYRYKYIDKQTEYLLIDLVKEKGIVKIIDNYLCSKKMDKFLKRNGNISFNLRYTRVSEEYINKNMSHIFKLDWDNICEYQDISLNFVETNLYNINFYKLLEKNKILSIKERNKLWLLKYEFDHR